MIKWRKTHCEVKMEGLYLSLIVFGVGIQQIAMIAHNGKTKNSTFSFCAAGTLVSSLIFIATLRSSFEYSPEVLFYSVAFSLSFCAAVVFSFLAIASGPLSLTSLITGYSLIVPTLYGLIALDEPIKITLIVGLLFLALSLFLINKKAKGNEERGKKVNLKWGIFVTLSFIGNGLGACVQKTQQMRFGGKYVSEFMIVSIAISLLILLTVAIFTERKTMLSNLKRGIPWFSIWGIANGGVNLGTILLAGRLPASVMFPVISAGGIVFAALVSLFVYKEKLSKIQWSGMLLGICAIVLLNL